MFVLLDMWLMMLTNFHFCRKYIWKNGNRVWFDIWEHKDPERDIRRRSIKQWLRVTCFFSKMAHKWLLYFKTHIQRHTLTPFLWFINKKRLNLSFHGKFQLFSRTKLDSRLKVTERSHFCLTKMIRLNDWRRRFLGKNVLKR